MNRKCKKTFLFGYNLQISQDTERKAHRNEGFKHLECKTDTYSPVYTYVFIQRAIQASFSPPKLGPPKS